MNLRGVVTVLTTPFHADASIDESSLRRQVDFCIAGGVAGLCAPAFGSEYYKLSDSERRRVAEVVVQHGDHRVPILVNAGSASLCSTTELSRHAESLGADAVMVAAPRAVPLGSAELMIFFEEVCRSVKIPVVLQDADFQGGGLPARLFIELAERCPNFQFVKLENILPGERCQEIISQSRGKIQVLYGWGGLRLFDGWAHGACGIMPGPALSGIFVQIFKLYDAGHVDEAKAWFYRILPFLVFALEHLELFIQMEKRVLLRRGVIVSDRLRDPTLRLDAAYQKQVEDLVAHVLTLITELPPPPPL
ncbi:MAG TPA: dihydrodipicolinate synthase family protein [Terriglobia bacterium]